MTPSFLLQVAVLSTFRFNIPKLSKATEDEDSSQVLQTLHDILKPFLLRRTKAEVERDLPPKKEYIIYAPLSEQQRSLYDAIVNGGLRNVLAGSKPNEEEVLSEEESGGRRLRKRRAHLKYDVDGDDHEYFKRLENGELNSLRDRNEDARRNKSAVELGAEFAYEAKRK